jgi:hypothetical protein
LTLVDVREEAEIYQVNEERFKVLEMGDIPNELRQLVLSWAKPEVFIRDKVKMASDVEHYVRKRIDEAMRSAARDILRAMPEDSWDITCKHLPDYDHRDEILWSNQMQKILDNEMEEEEEIQRYLQEYGRETGSVAGVELSLRILDLELYLESRDNLDRDRLETDTFFLQEIVNDMIKRNRTGIKGMDLLFDWLSELKNKSGYFDNEFFVKRFKEVVGEENWDQEGYEQYIQEIACRRGK